MEAALALADLAVGPKNALPDRLNIPINHPAFVYIEWGGNVIRREEGFRSVQKREDLGSNGLHRRPPFRGTIEGAIRSQGCCR